MPLVRPLIALALLALAAHPAPAAPERWAAEIDQLTATDPAQSTAPGGTVFVGSSSIRLWSSLAEDFPKVRVLNRGFGGSELADTVFFADRIILPYQPRAIAVYAGENDLWAGKSPETVLADFQALRKKIHAALPQARIIFLSVKLSPSRTRIHEQVRAANRLVAAECATDIRCTFVDVASALLGPDGLPRDEFFIADRLHLNPAGYAAWTKVLGPHLQE